MWAVFSVSFLSFIVFWNARKHNDISGVLHMLSITAFCSKDSVAPRERQDEALYCRNKTRAVLFGGETLFFTLIAVPKKKSIF